jgi:hypothetical protein
MRLLAAVLCVTALASAEVIRIEVQERSEVLGGREFGPGLAYERIIGKVFFAVDPQAPANSVITDILLAPRNAKGQVEFSSDLYMLKPRDQERGNGNVLFEPPNRGAKGLLGIFQRAGSNDPRSEQEFGDGFLLQQGYTLVWLGWQPDVPEREHLMRLYAPAARQGEKPVTGPVRAEFIPDRRTTQFLLGDGGHRAYPVVNPEDGALQLTVREREEGPRRLIPREAWRIEDGTSVVMGNGFELGKIYELVYESQDPLVAGLGLAAVRDFIAYLKYGGTPQTPADFRENLVRTYGFGNSQSAMFFRTFLYYGFNDDGRKRRVFDGLLGNVAGGRSVSLNQRFAQPGRTAGPFRALDYPSDPFPYSDLEMRDPETGRSDGVLTRSLKAGVVPKIFWSNSAYEYWGCAASLVHTTPDGTQDAPVGATTRIYLFSSGQHGPSAFPPPQHGTQNLANPNDFRWALRALLVALDGWVQAGKEPPASRYPRIADDRLVTPGAVQFPKIPGVAFPARWHEARRLDFGARFWTAGIAEVEPPKRGKVYAVLVPQVDADGNDLAGVRMPEIEVALGTYTGWNLRSAEAGAPDELASSTGSFIPFAKTKAERERRGDPRPAVAERYPDAAEYLKRFEAAAKQRVREGFLLERDVPRVTERGKALWEYVAGR